MQTLGAQKDTNAWVFQVWASFIVSVSATTTGICYLPVDIWTKGFVGMGLAFTVGSCFGLAKTVRDRQDTQKLTSRVDEARVEKLLAEHHPLA